MLLLGIDSKEADYQVIYQQAAGYVFKYKGNFETIMNMLQLYRPDPEKKITAHPINPGTDLYTDYGANAIIIVQTDFIP